MEERTAAERAKLTGKLTEVLDSRRLHSSNRRLAELLREGMAVLDVGCGTGAITRGIAEAVGPRGTVVGVDSDPELIAKARETHGDVPGLSFETADVYQLGYERRFDIVAAARVLVWLVDPLAALRQMSRAAKPGGRVVLADYNHERIEWRPEPPASMRTFYSAYLNWRSDAGFDNAIADRMRELMGQAGLADVRITEQHEIAERGAPGFERRIGIWADTAASRGERMTRDGFLEEGAWATAENEYRDWLRREAEWMRMYMLAAEGTVASR